MDCERPARPRRSESSGESSSSDPELVRQVYGEIVARLISATASPQIRLHRRQAVNRSSSIVL